MTHGKRLRYIDVARGISMFIIVFSHAMSVATHAYPVYRVLFFINVPIFFVLSGYTFRVKEGESFFKFLKNKFLRIMLPYFVWALVFLIPYLFFGGDVAEEFQQTTSFDLWTQIKNTLYGNGVNNALKQNGPLWFLPALFTTEVLYYAIVRYIKKWQWQTVIFAMSIVVGFLCSLFVKDFFLPWGLNSALTIGCFFYFGYLLKEWKVFEKMSTRASVLSCLVALVMCGLAIYFNDSANVIWTHYWYYNYFLTIIAGLTSAWLILQLSRLINRNKMFEFVGKNTMPILIFHKIVIIVMVSKIGVISTLVKDSNILLELLLVFAITIVTMVFSIVVGLAIRKILPELIGERRDRA